MTGHSKLNIPDDYQELIRVIIWHHRQRLKMGLLVLSLMELEEFLHQEMAQNFSDLGIEIEDFLSDLTKTRREEELSFHAYNNYIKKYQFNNSEDNSPITLAPVSFTRPEHLQSITPTKTPTIPIEAISRETNTQQQEGSPKNLMKKFISVNKTQNPQPSIIDKPINLKNNETRRHVHRYDLRIGLKECHSEEEEQRLLQGILEDFLDTMLSADKHILVPPYYELDRSNISFQDLSSTFKVLEVESFTKLKRYFSRLGNRNATTGFVYCSCIIAASEPHAVIMTKVSQLLQESKLSLWPRSSDHENVGRIGWLLYSLQDMDVNHLKALLTTLTGTEIGVKWMRVTNDHHFQMRCG
jgi:hypothetical protein